MLVRVSQEAINLTIKGVGLAIPDFMSATASLLKNTWQLLPIAHLLHPKVVARTRMQKGLRIVQGSAAIDALMAAKAFEAAKVIGAVSAALNKVRAGKASDIPSEAKAKKAHTKIFDTSLAFFRGSGSHLPVQDVD